MISQSNTTTFQLKIPLYFYNVPHHTNIKAPDQIIIHVQSTKKKLRALTTEPIAAHIDAQILKNGDNLIFPSKSTLFLPHHIELLHTTPCPVIITLEPSA